jgi:hypothetical protein
MSTATEASKTPPPPASSAAPTADSLHLLFLHHSCGGQLLADPGPEQGENCIYRTSPNGGGLRSLLQRNSCEVHEASYGSRLGQDTDLFHWWPKFRDRMPDILACKHQDDRLEPGQKNRIVVFKSCFPNNWFLTDDAPTGNPLGPELTVSNAQAAYRALLSEFQKQPEVLFVCVTAPPLAHPEASQPGWKTLARRCLGRSHPVLATGPLAREFNNWLKNPNGWLWNYPLRNVAVFDYFDILTGLGKSNFSVYATGNGSDSHPSAEGNRLAAEAFVPFLNRAVRRAGLVR